MDSRTGAIALLAALATSLGACRQYGCTDEARFSVTVTLQDANGELVKDATVEYTVNGGATYPCDDVFSDKGVYECGTELDGVFGITATKGSQTGTATVLVTSGECHVNGQAVTITLST